MVARLLRLRLTLLLSAFRGSFWHGVRAAAVRVLVLAAAVAAAAMPVWLDADGVHRRTTDVLIGSLLLAAVLIVPFFANRGHLEPRQFASFPYRSTSVAVSLLLTTIVSWPFLALTVWLVALGLMRPEWPVWVSVLALTGVAITAVASLRVSSALSKFLVGPERSGLLRAVGTLLLVAVLPMSLFALAAPFGADAGEATDDAVGLLGLTPFGAAFAGLHAAAEQGAAAALPYLLILFGFIVVLLAAWPGLVGVSNQTIDRPANPAVARRGLGWFERFAARPSQVIAARMLTYWGRDPRYRVALFAVPFAPLVMLVALSIAGADLTVLALIPLPVILLLLGWSLHNDVAMDSTAIWSHVASGIRGREDRLGRLAPVMLIGIPLALIGSSITVTVIGDWRILPAVIGMNLAVLLVSCGVSSVTSVLFPYPVTRPGDSPFVQPQWSGSGSGMSQTVSMLVSIALSLPAIWVSAQAVTNVEFFSNAWALAAGVAYGAIVLFLGVVIGGRVFDRRAPELIAVTQVFD